MDLKDIKQIIKVLEGTDVTEIEVEQEGVKVRVKRGGELPCYSFEPGSNATSRS